MHVCAITISYIWLSISAICQLVGGITLDVANEDRVRIPSRITNPANAAQEYYKSGMYFANNGQYVKAVAYLRGAVRLYNSSALYWNDLGVTEMRIHQYKRSIRRFLNALMIDPTFKTAKENLADIEAYLPPHDFELGKQRKYKQQHKLIPINEIQPSDLTFRNYSNDDILNQPFVIRNYTGKMNWILLHFNFISLMRHYGHYPVDFYPHNMKEEQVHPYFASLSDGIRQLLHYPEEVYEEVDASEPGTYLQWNLDFHVFNKLISKANGSLPDILTDLHWIDHCISDDNAKSNFQKKTHWKMLLIGEELSGMFNHKDSLNSASWQIQLVGRKKWHICSSVDDHNLYKAGEINTFHPNYKLFPKFRQVRTCSQLILSPGDMIFYPKEYWHQTLNLDTPTVSLTGTIVTSQNYESVIQELTAECSGRSSIYKADKSLCSQLELCFNRWRLIYNNSKFSDVLTSDSSTVGDLDNDNYVRDL